MIKTVSAYGVDLAGYSSKGKSQVAKVSSFENGVGRYLAAKIIPTTLLQGYKGDENLADAIARDVKVFSQLISNGGICAVDVPIDLQGLNEFSSQNKTHIWEATKRPIDYLLGALPPLADRIGAVVTRMQLIMKHFPNELGRSIFETYPAGTLAFLGKKQQYKDSKAIWQGSKWVPKKEEQKGLANMLNDLDFIGVDGQQITDDQFDAIISAIPLLCQPRLMGPALIKHPSLAKKTLELPEGFILCGEKFWSRVEVI